MMQKNESRLRRAKATRSRIRKLNVARLTVHRSGQHIYAQVILPSGDKVVASANTLQDSVVEGVTGTKNKAAAAAVGKAIAARAVAAGITKVAFDRSGFLYHGRIQALADAAREGGLQF